MERLTYALMGAFFGAVIGVACWWLYGMAFSIRHSGPGIDPNLTHWVKLFGGLFAVLGLVFKDKAGALVGNMITAIFHAESGAEPEVHLRWWQVLLVLALLAAGVWYVMR